MQCVVLFVILIPSTIPKSRLKFWVTHFRSLNSEMKWNWKACRSKPPGKTPKGLLSPYHWRTNMEKICLSKTVTVTYISCGQDKVCLSRTQPQHGHIQYFLPGSWENTLACPQQVSLESFIYRWHNASNIGRFSRFALQLDQNLSHHYA